MESGTPGPLTLVVDCPSEDYLLALCGDPVLRQLQETGAKPPPGGSRQRRYSPDTRITRQVRLETLWTIRMTTVLGSCSRAVQAVLAWLTLNNVLSKPWVSLFSPEDASAEQLSVCVAMDGVFSR